MLNRLSAPVTAAFFAFGLPASAELNPGHQVDPNLDIIVGDEDAAHELIVYFSPGCLGCIVLHDFLSDFYEPSISEDRLRIVYRLVPDFYHRGENNQLAQERSDWMARWLQCTYTTRGAEGFSAALDVFISYAMASNRRFQGRETTWPAITNARNFSFLSLLQERGVYTDPDQPACDAERARDIFARNFLLLDRAAGEERGRVRAPMLILDGRWLDDQLDSSDLNSIARTIILYTSSMFPGGDQ
ncbi:MULTISPECIES: thioredoxin domain-containing protein [Salipiger]|uniref:thioredoxin domain-containing protein n=1 Tax=Salipiger TaxID=263377 RepID=UPI003515B9B5